MNIFYRITVFFLKIYFLLFYRLKIYGLENLPVGPAIMAPNHVSFFDPPILAVSCKEEVSFLARASLFEHFLLGPIISRLNSYPVAGTAQDLASLKLICKLLKSNKKVVVFPEGIRSDDGELGTIKSGIGMLSIRSQAPIVPVYINGAYEVWNKSRKLPKPWGKITCVFGKPIYPQDFESFGKKEAQEKMGEATEKSILSLKSWLLDRK
jgi:1-acyl-sn-glycerol-3-phosphate acyltransferase